MGVADRYYMQQDARLAAEVIEQERVAFLQKTYLHLLGAILAFVGAEAVLLNAGVGENLTAWAMSGRWNWLLLFGGFILVSHIAENWARSATSLGKQYLGLAGSTSLPRS